MAYTVTFRTQSGTTIEAKDFEDLNDALEHANFTLTSGSPRTATITDEQGVELLQHVYNG